MVFRDNEKWLSDLNSEDLRKEEAIDDLRSYIKKSLPYAISNWLSSSSPYLYPLIDEVTQETILKVLNHIDTFQGKSHFTTWVSKIAVRIALTELRRKKWQNYSLEDLLDNRYKFDETFTTNLNNPEISYDQREVLSQVQSIINDKLSERQKIVMTAIVFQGIPNEVSCDEVLEMIDQFAELVMAGKNASKIMPKIQQHLDMCPDCREEYESLLKILEHNPPNKTP